MASFAQIKDNVVQRVIAAEQDFINSLPDNSDWKEVSINTRAGIGYSYDQQRDAFIPPQPYPSWLLNEDTCLWESPIPHPNDGKLYIWNEDTKTWDLINQN
jgi:hypothetical protein